MDEFSGTLSGTQGSGHKEGCTKCNASFHKSAARGRHLGILRLSKLPAMESPGECSTEIRRRRQETNTAIEERKFL